MGNMSFIIKNTNWLPLTLLAFLLEQAKQFCLYIKGKRQVA